MMPDVSIDIDPSALRGINITYQPSLVQRHLHSLPHIYFDDWTKTAPNAFNCTHNDFWNDYTQSLVPLPVICFAVGLIIFILSWFLFTRYWPSEDSGSHSTSYYLDDTSLDSRQHGKGHQGTTTTSTEEAYLRLLPDDSQSSRYRPLPYADDDPLGSQYIIDDDRDAGGASISQQKKQSWRSWVNANKYAILTCLGVLLAIIAQSYVGTFWVFRDGLITWYDLLDYIRDMSNDLEDEGWTLHYFGMELEAEFETATELGCEEAGGLYNGTVYFLGFIDEYIDSVHPVSETCEEISHTIELGFGITNIYVWLSYSLVLLLVAGLVYLINFSKAPYSSVVTSMTVIIILYLMITVAGLMYFNVGIADYCMDPSNNTAAIIMPDIREYLEYYADCKGQNPFQQYVNWAYEYVELNTRIIEDLLALPRCRSARPNLQQSLLVLSNISSTVAIMEDQIVCPPLNDMLLDFLNTGLCRQCFDAEFTLWICQSAIIILLIIFTLLYSTLKPVDKSADARSCCSFWSNGRGNDEEVQFSLLRRNDGAKSDSDNPLLLHDYS